MLGILVGMDQKDSNVQWYVYWFRAVFPSLSSGIVVAGEEAALLIDIGSGTFMAGSEGDDASAAFPSFVGDP